MNFILTHMIIFELIYSESFNYHRVFGIDQQHNGFQSGVLCLCLNLTITKKEWLTGWTTCYIWAAFNPAWLFYFIKIICNLAIAKLQNPGTFMDIYVIWFTDCVGNVISPQSNTGTSFLIFLLHYNMMDVLVDRLHLSLHFYQQNEMKSTRRDDLVLFI